MLSGLAPTVAPTTAGRTGERVSTHEGHDVADPFSLFTLKVSGSVVPDVGRVDRIESGRSTSKVVEDKEKSAVVGRALPFTRTIVVEMKFVPER
jgi:hypothetical protein